MMDIKVELTAEQINKAVAEAVMNSVVGKLFKEKLESTFKNPYDWDRWVGDIVTQQIRNIIAEVIRKDHYERVKVIAEKIVAEKLTEDFMEKVLRKVFDIAAY